MRGPRQIYLHHSAPTLLLFWRNRRLFKKWVLDRWNYNAINSFQWWRLTSLWHSPARVWDVADRGTPILRNSSPCSHSEKSGIFYQRSQEYLLHFTTSWPFKKLRTKSQKLILTFSLFTKLARETMALIHCCSTRTISSSNAFSLGIGSRYKHHPKIILYSRTRSRTRSRTAVELQ